MGLCLTLGFTVVALMLDPEGLDLLPAACLRQQVSSCAGLLGVGEER